MTDYSEYANQVNAFQRIKTFVKECNSDPFVFHWYENELYLYCALVYLLGLVIVQCGIMCIKLFW